RAGVGAAPPRRPAGAPDRPGTGGRGPPTSARGAAGPAHASRSRGRRLVAGTSVATLLVAFLLIGSWMLSTDMRVRTSPERDRYRRLAGAAAAQRPLEQPVQPKSERAAPAMLAPPTQGIANIAVRSSEAIIERFGQ